MRRPGREALHPQVLQEARGGSDRGPVRVPADSAEEQQPGEGSRAEVTAWPLAQAAVLLRKRRRGVPVTDRGDVSARVLSYPKTSVILLNLIDKLHTTTNRS